MARMHTHPRSISPKMDSRYFGLALVDPIDRYLRAWRPVPSCLQFDQQRVLSHFFSLLPPSPSSNGRLLHHGETKSGHDKLAQYGIEIYAAVDAYSRKIIWFYVGNSNRTQLSVLRQYLSAVKARGLCPSFIRTDKGTETIMLADAHFSLFTEAALAEHWPDEEYNSLRITDCYIYGPSTQNIRVEGVWRQQRDTTTGPWISYFKLLSLSG